MLNSFYVVYASGNDMALLKRASLSDMTNNYFCVPAINANYSECSRLFYTKKAAIDVKLV